MEVAGLVIALPPLIAGFWKVSQKVNNLRRRFEGVPSWLASIEVQCSALQNALSYLESSHFQNTLRENTQRSHIEHVLELLLSQCKETLTLTERRVEECCTAKDQMDVLAKATVTWNEGEIKELIAQLRGYQYDIGTLLMVCNSYSIETIRTRMDQRGPSTDVHPALAATLEEKLSLNDDATDVCTVNQPFDFSLTSDPDGFSAPTQSFDFSIISDGDRFSTTALYHDHLRVAQSGPAFDFDSEILGTRLYRRALQSGHVDAAIEQLAGLPNLASNHSLPTFPQDSDASKSARGYKVTILGDGGAGKSALITRFTQDSYVGEDYDPTIEDIYSTECMVDAKPAMLHITDTTGQEAYADLHDTYMHESDCFILVYDVTSRASFDEMQDLYARLYYARAGKLVPLVIVANKADAVTSREVSSQEGAALAQKLSDCPFFEASAKTGHNVASAFEALVRSARWLEERQSGAKMTYLLGPRPVIL